MFARLHILAGALLLMALWTSAEAQESSAPRLQDVLELTDIGGRQSGLSLSPDGQLLAFVQHRMRIDQDDYRHEIVLVDLRNGRARVLANAGDILIGDQDGYFHGAAADRVVRFSSDSTWIAYLRVAGGSVELWRVRANGQGSQRIAHGPGDVIRFTWQGARLIYETRTPRADLRERDAHALQNGFRVDARFEPGRGIRPAPDMQSGRRVWSWRNGHARPATAAEADSLVAEDQRALLQDNTRQSGASFWIDRFDPNDGAHRPVLGIYRRRSATDSAQRCGRLTCRGQIERSFVLDGGELYYLRTEGFARSDMALYQWRTDENEVRLVRREEGLFVDCVSDGVDFYCFHETSLQPRRLVRVDTSSGMMSVLYDPNPHWQSYALAPLERIDVHDQFGNPSFAYLLYPQNYDAARRYPMVVVQYRARGFLRGGVGGEYPVHEFSRRGYFVLNVERPNLDHLYAHRPHRDAFIESEREHIEHRAKQSAIEAMIEAIAARGLVDPDRIAITGLSDGAESLFWAVSHSDLFAVAVSATPPIDPIGWALTSERNRDRLRSFGLVDDRGGGDAAWALWWDEMSASRRIDRIQAPIMLHLAGDEALRAFPFYAHMRAQARAIELYLYPDAHHVKHRPRQIFASQQRTLDWIDFWLKGELHMAADDPGRAERWRALQATSPLADAALATPAQR